MGVLRNEDAKDKSRRAESQKLSTSKKHKKTIWKRQKRKNYKLQKFTATYLSEYCGTELKIREPFFQRSRFSDVQY